MEDSNKEKIDYDGLLPRIQAFCFRETKEFRPWCSYIYSVCDTSLFKSASSPAGRCIAKCSCLQGFINIGLVSALQEAPVVWKATELWSQTYSWSLRWTAASLLLSPPYLSPTTSLRLMLDSWLLQQAVTISAVPNTVKGTAFSKIRWWLT